MAVLDGAIANVALPTIAGDLNTSPAELDLGGERVSVGGDDLIAAVASLGDIFGYRRVYQWGLVVFTVASLGARCRGRCRLWLWRACSRGLARPAS